MFTPCPPSCIQTGDTTSSTYKNAHRSIFYRMLIKSNFSRIGFIASTSKIFPSLCCSLPISRTFTACPKMSSGYQSPKTVQQATTGCPQARFDLPGLNLPLNWTPHKEYTKYSQPDRLAFPKQGDGMDLFPMALNDQSLTDGYCA